MWTEVGGRRESLLNEETGSAELREPKTRHPLDRLAQPIEGSLRTLVPDTDHTQVRGRPRPSRTSTQIRTIPFQSESGH